jgi:hypothetical protein
VVAVAVITEFVGVVSGPDAGTARTFHLPATSARFTGAGAVLVVVVEDAAMLDVSTAASSFLAQAVRTAAHRHSAMLVKRGSLGIGPPVSGYGRRTPGLGAERSERTGKSDFRQETIRAASAGLP